MLKAIKSAALTLTLLTCAAVAGCASSGEKTASETHAHGGMYCPTCETVWTSHVTDIGMKTQRMVSKPGMTCPNCDAMAEAYFKNGMKVLHNCESCKVTPKVLTPSPEPIDPRGTHS